MAKFCTKKKSKRQPARLRYKIEKKVRDHNKKKRKETKKNPKKENAKLARVPNICPFKEDILKQAEALKNKKDEEKKRARELARQDRLQKKKEAAAAAPSDLGTLISNAEMRDKIYETVIPDQQQSANATNKSDDNSLKAYYKEFRKVIEAADVILEVVDARDPLGTCCPQVEKAVMEAPGNKRLVIVLNKSDLVPRDNIDKWIKYLRTKGPVIAFKSSTQNQSQKLGQRKMPSNKVDKAMQTGASVGADLLMSLLANYCRNKGVKTSILVGVVGLPNVGKSSLINSLKRSKACNVGATPGVTRKMQQVQLDSKIKLLDSPGIVFSAGSDAASCLRNAVKVSSLSDPIEPATAILRRLTKDQIKELYDVADFGDYQEFFNSKAARMGRFKKGGIPDVDTAARSLIEDWNSGKIKFYTLPPEENVADVHISSSIVAEIGKEFDLENFEAMQTDYLNKITLTNRKGSQPIESLGIVDEVQENEMDQDDIDDTNLMTKRIKVADDVKKPKRKRPGTKTEKVNPEMQLEGNQQLNKVKRLQFKKEKKDQKRRQKTALQLATNLNDIKLTCNDAVDNYDFQEDFTMK